VLATQTALALDAADARENCGCQDAKLVDQVGSQVCFVSQFPQSRLVTVVVEFEKLVLVLVLVGDQGVLDDLECKEGHSLEVVLVHSGWNCL
jgi:hypothetical protein